MLLVLKTAVSIPDEVFQEAGQLARRSKKSRSPLFSDPRCITPTYAERAIVSQGRRLGGANGTP
jgi:hypothetical protein